MPYRYIAVAKTALVFMLSQLKDLYVPGKSFNSCVLIPLRFANSDVCVVIVCMCACTPLEWLLFLKSDKVRTKRDGNRQEARL